MITHYTTLTRFGTRPVIATSEVMQALDISDRRKLPETYGRFWAVRGNA